MVTQKKTSKARTSSALSKQPPLKRDINGLSHIIIQGAREHNLKNISITFPRNKLIVITGLSGSGKSSLAFDTIYAEGQRRYVESLSAYARQFLELMQKPDVDSIEGLSPAISIEQKTTSKNPRSTVGTVTEIYDYLRLLFARIGIPYSPATGLPIESQSVSQMVDRILELDANTKLILLAPLVRGRKGEYRKEIQELQRQGFQRLRIDGEVYDIDQTPELDKKLKHSIDVVVDRLIVRSGIEQRLADSIETALGLSDGLLYVQLLPSEKNETEAPKELVFSSKFACPVSGFTIEEIEPRLFSFNNPFGACQSCDGLGTEIYFDEDLIIPNKNKSLKDGALAPWSGSNTRFQMQLLESLAQSYDFKLKTPWEDLPQNIRSLILHGSGKKEIAMRFKDEKKNYEVLRTYEGIIPNMERRFRETASDWVRDEFEKYQNRKPCNSCHGYRLKPEALAVKINHKHISEVTHFSIEEACLWFENLDSTLTEKQRSIAARILKEINERLSFLNNVGLSYLGLSRSSGTLSGGESQRIRLASQIGSGLTGVLYVLDEPSIGLHQHDNDRLLETLQHLRDLGNSVIVVEHDEDAIRIADHVVDIGPGAGIHGGNIIAEGTPEEIMQNPNSLTGQYLSGKRSIPLPEKRRKAKKKQQLTIHKAQANNLRNVTATIPLGIFNCITGVSGSGKSTLTIETLYKALARHLNGSRATPGAHEKIDGLALLDKIIDIDQSPIGRTPRSNPATYTGAFGPIRDWFANLPASKERGYKPGRFSFNVKGGRCETCQGDGTLKIEMHFLPDVYVTCDACQGKRYNRETLEIHYKGKSIADVLDMTIEEAALFFEAIPTISDKMKTLSQVGLDYIKVGQSATTLSGGEAQRVKLAKELSKRSTGRTIYILDEPTTGLHFEDIRKLLEVLHDLVDQGNTIIVIEHNLEVIKTADWIIDMGPKGGDKGGEIIAQGTPEEVSLVEGSYTGYYLKPYLNLE